MTFPTTMRSDSISLKSVILLNVQPLRGGLNLYLRGDGQAICQVIRRDGPMHDLVEVRYSTALETDQVAALARLIQERSFLDLMIPERAGIPEESQPTISVMLATGQSHTVAKWAGDKNPDFDPVFLRLLELAKRVQGGQIVRQGPLDPNWRGQDLLQSNAPATRPLGP